MNLYLSPLVAACLGLTLNACDEMPQPGTTTAIPTNIPSSTKTSEDTTSTATQTSVEQSTSGDKTGPALTKIHQIQRHGQTPNAQVTTIEAIVTATFQDPTELRGFFVQEEDTDADNDPQTSEGIFIYTGPKGKRVKVGDRVQIQGKPTEFYGMTQLVARADADIKILASNQALPTATPLQFPIPVTSQDLATAKQEIDAYFEAREGMRVRLAQPMSIGNTYNLARYGELELVAQGRIRQFTDASPPSVAGFTAHQIDAATRSILWDDNNNTQNTSTLGKGGDRAIFHPQPQGFSVDNFIRSGATVRNLVGVLHWSFSGQKGTDAWRIRSGQNAPSIEHSNPRPKAPVLKSDLKVTAFNVLNYFSTLDTKNAKCGPQKNMGCRGANSPAELERQGEKIAAALCELDADIVGLMEIENNDKASLDSLIAALDRRCPGYKPVYSGAIGNDAIKVGLIYKHSTIGLQGAPKTLTDAGFTDPHKLGRAKNRPALLATFVDKKSKQKLSVVVNHLKSKGSPCGAGDDDKRKGQGNCNLTRTLAAKALAKWLNNAADAKNILILGDLNAYRKEDPITTLQAAGYTDLVAKHDPNAHSYVFSGQLGNLDYALANEALAKQVRSATVWNINSDESSLLDYNDTILDPGERKYERKSTALPLYRGDAYRASDHDPVVVGLNLRAQE